MLDLEFVGDYRQPQLTARQRALGHDGRSAGEFSFGDFLDIINPLQHIPIISSFYREITGDEISPHARVIGDTLFGGPTGFLASIANVLYEEVVGEDVGETALALFTGDDAVEADPQVAGPEGPVVPAAALAHSPAASEPARGVTFTGDDAVETAAGEATAPVLPEPPPGMLTGQAALDALFMDLAGRRAQPAPMPVEPARPRSIPEGIPLTGRGAQARSYPLPMRPAATPVPAAAPAAAPATATNPLLFAQETAEGAVADRMMQALDKYQAMARQNGTTRRKDEDNVPAGGVRWQSDPAAAANNL